MRKRGIVIDELGWWLLALVFLAICIAAVWFMSGKSESLLSQIKDLFNLG